MGGMKSGHHPDLKYWLHKIGHAKDAICRKCVTGEETAVHPPHEPTAHDTLAIYPKVAGNIGEMELLSRPT